MSSEVALSRHIRCRCVAESKQAEQRKAHHLSGNALPNCVFKQQLVVLDIRLDIDRIIALPQRLSAHRAE